MDRSLHPIRREYGSHALDTLPEDMSPFALFLHWFNEIKDKEIDPSAMVLSTVDDKGSPDSRVVLLKEIDRHRFIFFTHYSSVKGRQLAQNAQVALNFYWPSLARQVRIRGGVEPESTEKNQQYFQSRPLASQMNAIMSPQSEEVADPHALDQKVQEALDHYTPPLTCPKHWGGYGCTPESIEFFQGRDNRNHHRLLFTKVNQEWSQAWLAP